MQTAIEWSSNGHTLRGMLHQPDGLSNVPLVILFHEYGATKTENKFIYVELSRILEQKGIASIRFDFFGSGESDGELQQKSFASDMVCARDILSYAHTLSFVDQERIAIVGKGSSCLIASQLSAEMSADAKAEGSVELSAEGKTGVKALVLLSPTVKTWNEQYSLELQAAELELDVDRGELAVRAVSLIAGEKEDNKGLIERYQKLYQQQLSLCTIADVSQVVETVNSREQMMEHIVAFLENHLPRG